MPRIASGELLPTIKPLWDEFVDGDLEHPEIRRRQKETRSAAYGFGGSTSLVELDYWKFVDDAIRGVGGFLDGSYIFPHAREVSRQSASLKKKALARLEMADYDNFAGVIAEAPWIHIVRAADMIKRDPQGVDGLDEFWADVDGNGCAMLDFLEYPFMQARAYGTAFVRMDRPATMLRNEAENLETPVVLHCLPTSAFKWWTLDMMGNLTGVVYCLERPGYEKPTIYLWTLDEYTALVPVDAKDKENYSIEAWGTNPLAEQRRLPFVRMHDVRPAYGEALGQSIMLNIAKIARQVFNTDSEIVELRRNTAFPFLALSMKNASQDALTKLEIGTSSAVPYDGDGDKPGWVAPELEAMTKLTEYRQEKRNQAFAMAHMTALSGYESGQTIQTNSGFHAEMEMDKTNTRIGKCAAALECFEKDIMELWAAFRGVEFGDPAPTVEYPRDFGLRDLDKLIDRTGKRLGMNLGEGDTVECLRDFYQGLYPRKPKDEIEKMARDGARAHANMQAAEQQAMLTPRDRAQRLMQRNRSRAA